MAEREWLGPHTENLHEDVVVDNLDADISVQGGGN